MSASPLPASPGRAGAALVGLVLPVALLAAGTAHDPVALLTVVASLVTLVAAVGRAASQPVAVTRTPPADTATSVPDCCVPLRDPDAPGWGPRPRAPGARGLVRAR